MKISYMSGKALAEGDEVFVLTEKGYIRTPDSVKPEREIGKPIKHFEKAVPLSWYKNGWVTIRSIANPC